MKQANRVYCISTDTQQSNIFSIRRDYSSYFDNNTYCYYDIQKWSIEQCILQLFIEFDEMYVQSHTTIDTFFNLSKEELDLLQQEYPDSKFVIVDSEEQRKRIKRLVSKVHMLSIDEDFYYTDTTKYLFDEYFETCQVL